MLVIVNKRTIKQFNACNGQSVILFSILFDEYDYMATACNNSQLFFYIKDGNYLNKNILTVSNPFYVGLDSKSRLLVVTNNQISLYN
jgi:hypothetical protein